MTWDIGIQGLAVLAAISLGFGLLAGLLVGGGAKYRLSSALAGAVACLAVGAITSEWIFGWATGQELQPNIDGLSRDEVLLSSVLTTAAVVLAARHHSHRTPTRTHPQ